MRSPDEIPRAARRGFAGRGRIVLVVAAVAIFLLATSIRGIARFYTDYLWYDSLELSSVWSTRLGAQIVLSLIFTGAFFALMWMNLTIADRIAPKFRPTGPEEELLERYHEVVGRRASLVRIGISLLFAFIAGVGVSSHWVDWILFTNRVDFGVTEPLFGLDVGFFVFWLPFLTWVVNWAFASLIIILIVTAVAHYLNGGIRVQTPSERVTPQVKAHLSVLLGIMALIKAAQYQFATYELALARTATVDGALYTAVHAQLPAFRLLFLISLFAAGLFLYNIWRRGWVMPVLAVGLWAFVAIVVGNIYPRVIQRVSVEPDESAVEEQFIERNIEATKAAFNLDGVNVNKLAVDTDLVPEDIAGKEDTLRNIRLLDPGIVKDTFQSLQADRGFYQLAGDLDVDRYEIDNKTTQVVLAARELSPPDIPAKSWIGRHLVYTHGYGLALAAANETGFDGLPKFLIEDQPARVDPRIDVTLAQPQLYYGEQLTDYSIVKTKEDEVDYLDAGNKTEFYEYTGEGGVVLSSAVRRAAFSLRFANIDTLISDSVSSESRIMFHRDIRDRVQEVAPFLRYDADPYPVLLNDGSIVYVIDAYTTSNNYPYAQRADNADLDRSSGLKGTYNYVRNSVKVVVDAYDGRIDFYVMPDGEDGVDPIAKAFQRAFPKLFSNFEDMPDELKDHLRYPEDLFRVQTNMWGRYHLNDGQAFYNNTARWQVAQDSTKSDTAPTTIDGQVAVSGTGAAGKVEPVYLLTKLPNADAEEFVILRSFVPFNDQGDRKELAAFMAAKSDRDNYGEMEVYEIPGTGLDGPELVIASIEADREIAQETTLLDQKGSEVKWGNLLLVPIGETVVYVRPLYVQAELTEPKVPRLERVVVAAGSKIAMAGTLEEALVEVFGPAADPSAGAERTPETTEPADETPSASDEEIKPGDETPPVTRPITPSSDITDLPEDATINQLADRADVLFVEADAALRDGDLSTYQSKVNDIAVLVERIKKLSETEPENPGSA